MVCLRLRIKIKSRKTLIHWRLQFHYFDFFNYYNDKLLSLIILLPKYSLLIDWKLNNLSQIVSITEQLNFNCIGGIWSDKFRFAVDDKKKAWNEEAVVKKNKNKIDRNLVTHIFGEKKSESHWKYLARRSCHSRGSRRFLHRIIEKRKKEKSYRKKTAAVSQSPEDMYGRILV